MKVRIRYKSDFFKLKLCLGKFLILEEIVGASASFGIPFDDEIDYDSFRLGAPRLSFQVTTEVYFNIKSPFNFIQTGKMLLRFLAKQI